MPIIGIGISHIIKADYWSNPFSRDGLCSAWSKAKAK